MNKKTPTLDLRLSEGAQWQIAPLAGDAPRRFSGIANSGRPFGYGSYQMVVDFDGIRLKDKTAVLIDHDGRQRAGVCTLSVVPDGLKADGVLLDNQHGQAVAQESDAGFPWEMSVFVQSDRVEELSAGASVEVNGQTVTGPMMIMRGCAVREVSFTAVGVDAQTHAAALSGFATPIQPEKENTMSMTPEEKAEFDAMAAKLAALEAEKAELQQSKQKAETDAKLAAAGFKKGEDGKFSGLSDATYAVLLSADPAALDAVIADIAPTALVLEGLAKISFGEMAANFERAAADMKASAEKHFGEAEKRALSFESAAVRAAKHSMETEEQRFSRLEAEARTAYQTAADAAVKAAEQAKSAQEAAAKAVGEAQQKAAQEAADAAQKTASAAAKSALKAESEWQKAAVAAGLATEEMAKIRQPLLDAGIEAERTAGKVSEIGGAAQTAAVKLREAFKQIGVDTDAVTEGIGAKAKQAFADFQTASETAREQGVDDARLIRNGFEQMMGKLQSRAEFAAFREQLAQSGRTADLTREQIKRLNEAAENGASAAKTAYDRLAQAVKDASDPAALQNLSSQAKQAFSDGLITAAQYDQTLAEVKRRSAEVAQQSATMGEAAKTAHNEAAAAARRHAEAVSGAAQAAQKGAQQQAAAVQGVGQAASGAVRRVTRLHEVFSTQYGNIKLTREEFAALNAEIDRFKAGQPKAVAFCAPETDDTPYLATINLMTV